MAETKKINTLIEKSIFNRHETKKTKTFIEKASRVLKILQIQMKKGHSTVFHNAWDQKQTLSSKNQFSIGLRTKKTKTLIEKLIRVLKTF